MYSKNSANAKKQADMLKQIIMLNLDWQGCLPNQGFWKHWTKIILSQADIQTLSCFREMPILTVSACKKFYDITKKR